jgi:hypothetical protein
VKVINPFLIPVKLKVNSHSESEMILNSYNFQIVLEPSISDEGKTRNSCLKLQIAFKYDFLIIYLLTVFLY